MASNLDRRTEQSRLALGDWHHLQDRSYAEIDEQVEALAERIAEAAADQLGRWGSELSADHLRGIREASLFIAEMAHGVARDEMAISSMSTGMGKSEIAATTGRLLTSDPALSDVGMIYLASTKRDLEGMIERMGFNLGPDPRYAVWTGKQNVELNALGLGYERRQEASVLFMTQAKFLFLSRYRKNFERNKHFFYRDTPRQVRIWDESILPIDTITLTVDQIETVAGGFLKKKLFDVAQAAIQFASGLSAKPHDSVIEVPLMPLEGEGETGPLRNETEEEQAVREELERLSSMLFALGGEQVRVYRDEHSGAVMISFRDILPRLLAPLLVLDASADKRAVYQHWKSKAGRGLLRFLYSPKKSYSNLTVHFADLRAGKEAHRSRMHRNSLVGAAVAAFLEAMGLGAERVLFLHNKPEKPHQDMQKLIRREIKKRGGDPDRATFLTWGMHKATNEFADIKHVVAVGVQQAPLYEITAMARGVARVPAHEPIAKEKVAEVRETEILHTLFQGAGRSAVRKTVDGDVPEGTHLWLIASTLGHMPFPKAQLGKWFPGARAVDWEPFGTILRGGSKKTDNRPKFVEAWQMRKGEWVEAKDFAPALSKQVARRMLSDEAVRRALQEKGLEVDFRQANRRGGVVHQFRLREAAALKLAA